MADRNALTRVIVVGLTTLAPFVIGAGHALAVVESPINPKVGKEIADYNCGGSGPCKITCKGGGYDIELTGFNTAVVFYYAEYPRRVWLIVTGSNQPGEYLLGENTTCWFSSPSSSPNK
jgi:hypothetical protein